MKRVLLAAGWACLATLSACSPSAAPVAPSPVVAQPSGPPARAPEVPPLAPPPRDPRHRLGVPVSGHGAPGGPLDPGELRLELRVDGFPPEPSDPHRFVLKAPLAFTIEVAVVGRDTREGSFAPLVQRTGGAPYGVALAFTQVEGAPEQAPRLQFDAPILGNDYGPGKLFAKFRTVAPEPDAATRKRAEAQTGEFVKMSREQTAVAKGGGAMSDEDRQKRDAMLAQMTATIAQALKHCGPGRYRVTADYVSGGAGRWAGTLQAPPIEIVIRD